MGVDQPDNSLTLDNVKTRIFYFSAGFVIYGEILDLFIGNHNLIGKLSTITTFIIIALVIILRIFKTLNNAWANTICVYILLTDIHVSLFSQIGDKDMLYPFFIRTSIIGLALIPYAGFNIHKFHCIVIGAVVFINYCIVSLLDNNIFMIRSIAIVLVIEFAFVYGMYVILHHFMRYLQIREDLLKRMEHANESLERRKAVLKELNDSKTTLLSIISHDLRTPFNNIIGFVDLQEFAIAENNIEKTKKYHVRIKQSTRIAYNLLKNLMDWASTQYDEVKVTPTRFKLYNLIDKIIGLNSNVIGGKRLTTILDIPIDYYVTADENMLSSIYRNLISNAIKFSPIEGEIYIGMKKEGNTILYFIRDNGEGVSKDKLQHLFSGKLQKSTPGTLNELGSGLGLSICRKFIDKHAGSIWAELNPDIGFTIFFTLYAKVNFENGTTSFT